MSITSPYRRLRAAASRWRLSLGKCRDFKQLQFTDFQSGLGDSAWFLYGLVRAQKPTICVEIGSARGKSACFVGQALKENGAGKLYAIDPHCTTEWNDSDSSDTFDVIRKNLNSTGVASYVEIVRATSQEAAKAWQREIDFLFIDGDHSYEGVKRDYELFRPYVSQFGLVIFHDTLWDLNPDPKYARADMGVPRLVEELRQEGYPVITLSRDFGVSIIQPTKGGVPLSNSQTRAVPVGAP